MSIHSEITRIQQAKIDLISKIAEKGVSVPSDASIDDLASLVQTIQTGADVSGVTATEVDVVAGKVFVDALGAEKAGALVVQTYYYGADEPSADLGVDGDIYFVME